MIRVDVEEYCQECLDFTPDVTKPERIQVLGNGSSEDVYSDTIVQCKYRRRCASITRFLAAQVKGENK